MKCTLAHDGNGIRSTVNAMQVRRAIKMALVALKWPTPVRHPHTQRPNGYRIIIPLLITFKDLFHLFDP